MPNMCYRSAFALGMVTLLASAGQAVAGVTYSDQSTFLAELQPGAVLEDFESRSGEAYGVLPLGNGAFTASCTTTANALIVFDLAGNDYLTTGITPQGWSAPITITFTSGNVTAVGGAFFFTSPFGAVAPGTVTLGVSDGTHRGLANQANTSFFGYAGDTPIASLTISPDATHRFVSLDNLRFGASTIPAPAAGVSALLAAALVTRRRR